MNFDNFTIKAQEAVNHSVKIAEGNNQQAIETGHLLKGLMVNAESVTGFLLKKLGVNIPIFTAAIPKLRVVRTTSPQPQIQPFRGLLRFPRKWVINMCPLNTFCLDYWKAAMP
jgi:ATP-dependent Clp protease ATP-binding subunit ClpA